MMSPPSFPDTPMPDASAADAARLIVKKSMWTDREDEVLREQVRRFGAHNWDDICKALDGRNSKSCRLRWCQHLDPRVEAVKPFTREEDALIVKLQAEYGNRWSTIADFLSGRTDNAVKNRWNSVLRKHHDRAPAPISQSQHPRPCAPPAPAARQPAGPEVSPRCLQLFPLASGDVKMDTRGPALSPRSFQVSPEAETCAAARKCLPLFPLAPGDVRGNPAPSDMSCGAGDPLTQMRLGPAAPVVFDVMPLQAYRM